MLIGSSTGGENIIPGDSVLELKSLSKQMYSHSDGFESNGLTAVCECSNARQQLHAYLISLGPVKIEWVQSTDGCIKV